FGEATLKNLGPAMVLPDGALQHLIDCAHAQKIITVEDIARETKWRKVHDYGDVVLKIIHK
ncbi:hypothetical protein BKA93DRAFT_703188, partial [Sparassis latifolia]